MSHLEFAIRHAEGAIPRCEDSIAALASCAVALRLLRSAWALRRPRRSRRRRQAGFVTLFNGKDLSGWHGQETMDPRKFAAMSAEEKAKQLAEGAEDMKKHWRVEDGEIVNDGQGAYLTTDKDYGDIELFDRFQDRPQGRQRRLSPRHAPGPDLGLHRAELRQDGGRQGLGRALEQQPGQPRQRSACAAPTTRSASGTRSGSSRSARGPRST